ncbi:MAG TPA: hypothetical protein VNT55_07750 [Baekduia sp.]|nr:hypothetical protein [Baekduia sp.]
MGHHARTLSALVVAVVATLVGAVDATAFPSVVRVETKAMSTISSGAFVGRMAVDTPGEVVIADADDPSQTDTCAATSPVAAVIAAVGPAQVKTVKDATSGKWLIASIKGIAQPAIVAPATSPAWFWRLYVDQAPVDNDGGFHYEDACTSTVPTGSEVLLYQACGAKTLNCYTGTPLYMRVRDGGPYDIAAQTVPGRKAPIAVKTIGDMGPTGATVTTDEGNASISLENGVLPGQTGIFFDNYGPHVIMASKGDGSRPPVRMNLCVSEGNDGFCGSTRYQPPAEVPYVTPSPCDTNGHDGLCGTTDTSGPVTHVTNITNKKVFKAKKGPGQVKGTIDVDPNGVKDVQLRLTRVVSVKTKVKVKTKKKTKKPKYRYKTVKRCTAWDDGTALLKSAKCGTKYAKWFQTDLSDLRNEFSYSFAMTLPRGTYTLEVLARDENGFKDATAAGRNVLTFTVK